VLREPAAPHSGAYHEHAGGHGSLWQFGYDGSVTDREGKKKDISEFWEEFAGPYPANLSLARHWNQRSYEWNPDDIAFQFLVSCSRKEQFESYVRECMQLLKDEIAVHCG